MGSETSLVLKQQATVRELRQKITDLTEERDAWKARFQEAMLGTPDDVLAIVRNPWKLTQKEMLVMLALMRRPSGVSKQRIHDAIYGLDPGDTPELKIVDVFVCKIRKKLADAGLADAILTLWGTGYRINDERHEQIVYALGYNPFDNKTLDRFLKPEEDG